MIKLEYISRWLLFVLCLLSVGCSTLAGPYSAYQVDQSRINQKLNSRDIGFEKWMEQSDELLRKYYPGDFRVERFIGERRKLLQRYRAGELSDEVLDTTLREQFEPIREEREARYYAELPVGEDKIIHESLQDTAILLNSIGNILNALRR